MSMSIRPALPADASRIAEIIVFNNRLNFFPIFGNEGYSFGEMQVVPMAQAFREDADRIKNTYVYDDGIVRGLLMVRGDEIEKLYVEPALQSQGVGAALLEYAVSKLGAQWLWALEKNERALRFYKRHGFVPTGERKFEDGTTEYLVKLVRQ